MPSSRQTSPSPWLREGSHAHCFPSTRDLHHCLQTANCPGRLALVPFPTAFSLECAVPAAAAAARCSTEVCCLTPPAALTSSCGELFTVPPQTTTLGIVFTLLLDASRSPQHETTAPQQRRLPLLPNTLRQPSLLDSTACTTASAGGFPTLMERKASWSGDGWTRTSPTHRQHHHQYECK